MRMGTGAVRLLVFSTIFVSGCSNMHIAEQSPRDTSKDHREESSAKTFDIQWGDSAKSIEAVLGRPSERGYNPHGQRLLIYRHGKTGGDIRFVFGSEGAAISSRKGMSDKLSSIMVVPKSFSDMSAREIATEIGKETHQTLPRIGDAKGFLGDFLRSRGFKPIHPSETRTSN